MIERIILWTIIVILGASAAGAQGDPCDRSRGLFGESPTAPPETEHYVPGQPSAGVPDQVCKKIGNSIMCY